MPMAMWTAGICDAGKKPSAYTRRTSRTAFARTATIHADTMAAGILSARWRIGMAKQRSVNAIEKKSVAEHARTTMIVTPRAEIAIAEGSNTAPK